MEYELLNLLLKNGIIWLSKSMEKKTLVRIMLHVINYM